MYIVNDIKIDVADELLSKSKSKFREELINRLSTNRWEKAEYSLLQRLDPHSCVIELGGCIGFISCYTNTVLLDKTNHVVVEANPHLIETLENNRQLNNCKFHIKNTALVKKSGDLVRFKLDKRSLLGSSECDPRISGSRAYETINITGHTLLDLEEEYECKFDTLICDIEGSEYKLFTQILSDKEIAEFNTMCIEFHTNVKNHQRLKRRILDKFKTLGFILREVKNAIGAQKIVLATKGVKKVRG